MSGWSSGRSGTEPMIKTVEPKLPRQRPAQLKGHVKGCSTIAVKGCYSNGGRTAPEQRAQGPTTFAAWHFQPLAAAGSKQPRPLLMGIRMGVLSGKSGAMQRAHVPSVFERMITCVRSASFLLHACSKSTRRTSTSKFRPQDMQALRACWDHPLSPPPLPATSHSVASACCRHLCRSSQYQEPQQTLVLHWLVITHRAVPFSWSVPMLWPGAALVACAGRTTRTRRTNTRTRRTNTRRRSTSPSTRRSTRRTSMRTRRTMMRRRPSEFKG